MAFTSFGADKDEALAKSYAALKEVSFEGMNYRTDIGSIYNIHALQRAKRALEQPNKKARREPGLL